MKITTLLLLSLFAVSCASMKKLAISNSVGVFEDGEKALNNESYYEFIRESALANIKTLEALHYASPEDEELIALLVKGYAGYSFGVLETEAFSDILLDKLDSERVEKLKAGYTKAIEFGLLYFKLHGIKQKELLSLKGMDKVNEEFSDLSSADKKALFFFAQSLAGIFNLEKQNMFLLGTTPVIVGLMEKVCKKDPDFENGACQLFQAVFEATKPTLMGGSIEKANKLFSKTFKANPKNLLNKVTYIQYSLVPMIDETQYKKYKKELKTAFKDFNRVNNFGELIKAKANYPKELNLFNAIASERFKHLISIENKLF
tara:strand:- start:78986 stop:79936 length:951 start_codon:yes stop_codon:yes gene_type:complete